LDEYWTNTGRGARVFCRFSLFVVFPYRGAKLREKLDYYWWLPLGVDL